MSLIENTACILESSCDYIEEGEGVPMVPIRNDRRLRKTTESYNGGGGGGGGDPNPPLPSDRSLIAVCSQLLTRSLCAQTLRLRNSRSNGDGNFVVGVGGAVLIFPWKF